MLSCETCGAAVAAEAIFCSQCGTRLGPGLSAQASSALRRAERKVVTVLFADIKGSLALVAGQDPELAGELLGQVTACMTEAVRRHGGLVNQVMGDGIMALFGAPIAMEDHAAQACLAALAMRVAVQTQVRPQVRMRVGLGSGEVVVRAVQGDVGLHYSGAGEAVHFASRMEGAAGPDEILITEATRALAAGVIEVRGRDDVGLKGVEEPMPVFELLGTRSGRALPAVRAAGLLVGRDREMELLRQARDRAASGEGQAIRLVGEAGAGKSRLVREFALSLGEEWLFCEAAAVPHRRTSYGVVGELLAGLFQIDPADVPAARREKLGAGLALGGAEAAVAMAPLSSLLGLEAAAPGWGALDGWERRERTIAATVQAFQRASLRRPLAVVVEDAHWLDAESANSIQRLGATAAGRRVLGLVTHRSALGAEDAGAWRDAHWAEYPVRPLDAAATVAFLRSRLLPGPDVAALERKLVGHTSGNPLFLEECLQTLVDKGELVRRGELYRLVAPVHTLSVPASLRGLLDARVDRLPDAEKDVLQAAAVVGSAVPMDLLARAVELDGAALDRALGRLVEAGFLVRREGASAHAFRHGLIRDAAYDTILKRTRVRMHAAVLGALEQRPGQNDGIVDLLADHASQAEAWPKAVEFARLAATKAYGQYANPEAVRFFDQAIRAAEQLEGGPGRDAMLLGLHIGRRWPLFHLGNIEALLPTMDEAARLAAGQPGHAELAQALVLRSHVHWLAGDPVAALADAAEAMALAERHGDEDLHVRARFQRGLVGLSQSDARGTLADMQAVLAWLGPAWRTGRYGLDVRLGVNALSYAARAQVAAGDLVGARASSDSALALAGSLEPHQVKIYAHIADSVVALAEGRVEPALRAAAEADELCRTADVRLLSPVAASLLAQAHAASGHMVTALPIARQAVEDAERMGFLALQAARLVVLAEIQLALSHGMEALATARAAVDAARRTGEAGSEALALAVIGDALLRQNDLADAAKHHGEALAVARRLGLGPLGAEVERRGGGFRLAG